MRAAAGAAHAQVPRTVTLRIARMSDYAETMAVGGSIAAVVVNWRDTERTLRCVRSLLESPVVGSIFLIDNASDGGLREAMRASAHESWDRVALTEHEDNRGFAGAVNRGMEQAILAGFVEILAINNDATIDERSLTQLIDELRADRMLALVAPMIRTPAGEVESAGEYLNPWLGVTGRTRADRSVDFATWACVLVSAEALKVVGLLDERFFMYWEDVTFSLRARSMGWRIAISSTASAVHETSANRQSHPVAIKAYHTWSSITFAQQQGGAWRVGNIIWVATSSLANVVRGRRAALRGIRLGIRLAREKHVPAHESPLRKALFD